MNNFFKNIFISQLIDKKVIIWYTECAFINKKEERMKQFSFIMIIVMMSMLHAKADDKIVGFFLANDAGLTKTKLSEWHDATSFILEKKLKESSGVALQTDREILTKSLRYKTYNEVDACVRSELCIRTALNREMLDGMVIATLIKQGEKFVVEVMFVYKDEQHQTIRTKTPYELNAMMDEVSNAIASIVAEQFQDQRGTLEISLSPDDATITCNGTPIKAGITKLKEGSYLLKVSKSGFMTHEEKVIIHSNDEKKMQVRLESYVLEKRVTENDSNLPRRDAQLRIETRNTSLDLKKTYLISASVSTALSATALVIGGIYTAQVVAGIDKSKQCANEFCSDFVGAQYDAQKVKASDSQLIANTMWGIGGATALASITLWVLYGLEEDKEVQNIPSLSFVPYQDGGMVLISY